MRCTGAVHLPPEDASKITRGNAVRMLGLEPETMERASLPALHGGRGGVPAGPWSSRCS